MLRKRKNRRYNEETNDEEEGGRRFDIHEQIRSERFNQIKDKHLQELNGDAITLKLIQRNGFERPILVKEPNGLDLRVPPKSFHVRDVRNCVGHHRIIDVMDVKTQKNIEMSMKDWCKYYESRNRDRLLNVISLEFSHTQLDELVEAPMIVKLLDWVDLVWPKFLKESQTESTNTIDKMKYPKVQKYCLMSVKGSYTDFHIDFGGTSVWYHIIRGKKIFWMVPPTELNLQTFEEWTLSGMQQDVFFGDTVEECFRVELTAGNTFFIPSGWIHAVYTIEDSLVFGGNFLHSFGIENQLKVSKIEDATKVPLKFRYPFYTEISWYAVQHYVHCLTGKDHLHRPDITAKTTPEKVTVDSKASKKDSTQDDMDDETTESEQEECDTKRKSSATKRRGRPPKMATKKSKKQEPPSDDDSTEIDSANEEDLKLAEKKSANTCRMTKNSLLRLQYEIDELKSPHQEPKSKPQSKTQKNRNETTSESTHDEQSSKPDETSSEPIKKEEPPAIGLPSTGNMMNLTDLMLSHDSAKSNGWSTNNAVGAQTTWSNPDSEPKEPSKLHLTKYELNGLRALVKHLSKLSGTKKNLPTLIRNSRTLLDDCRKLIAEHENDDPELAITGKPITTDILSPKKSNINELIEQFFKPTDAAVTNDQHSPLSHSPRASLKCAKSDSTSLTQQQRLKLGAIDEKKTPTCSTDAPTSKLLSPHREAKSMSPSKKATPSSSLASSSSSSAPSAASSTLPRPKSPPTRPISNNQYKTKNNNDLLLPGSFADLIAATSTQKKAFDVGPSDITSSLFGIKDSSPVKPTTSHSKTNSNQDKDRLVDPFKMMQASPKAQPTKSDHHATERPAPTNPISPEPPKSGAQKRFINPAFRPQVKEKLIFASAPYVSPVNASDQNRPGGLYPWQSPAPAPGQQTPSHPSQQPRPQPKMDPLNSSPGVIQHSTFSSDASGAKPKEASIDSKPHESSHSSEHRLLSSPDIQTSRLGPTISTNLFVPSQKLDRSSEGTKKDNQQGPQPSTKTGPQQAPIIKPIITPTPKQSLQTSPKQEAKPANSGVANPNTESDQKIKKPTKPRGPPKKSKEARLVLETSANESAAPPAPTSVIKLGPSAPVVDKAPETSTAPPTQSASAKDKPEKPKAKRKSKSKVKLETPNQTPPTSSPSGPQAMNLNQVPGRLPICGLVAPSMVGGGAQAKVNPQQYLISRPLLFNTMPTLTSAQFQQMSRTPMPLLTTQVPPSMSLPHMQQGARIVWATQPRRFPGPVATTAVPVVTHGAINTGPASNKMAAPMGLVPATSAGPTPDNAALLSLATTALSTAPLSTTSPALSHLSARPAANQAIMVSSAGSQPTLFTNQQFLSSIIQRMPMTPFAPSGPGMPRQPGQLVFARLPNQQQPRYLITQPGLLPPRPQIPLVAGQPGPAFAFAAAYKPPVGPDSAKAMKPKKVKTN